MLDMGWMLEKTENPQRRPGWGLTNFSFGVSDAWASEYMGLEVLPTHFFLLQCWETRLGQEMYKLLVFDLLTGLAVMLFIQFPRK
jgi:hypothetical protein